jgi:hypothetical protein
MEPLIICFHGTNREAATIIEKQGFKKGTYFARSLADAVEFSRGNHIFEVVFKKVKVPLSWQFLVQKRVLPSMIVRHYVFNRKFIRENEKLRKKVFKSNII